MFFSAKTWPEHKHSVHNTAAQKLDLNIKHKKNNLWFAEKYITNIYSGDCVGLFPSPLRYYKHVLSLHQGNSNLHLREIPRPPGKVTELSTIWILISAVTTFCGKCLLWAGSLRSKTPDRYSRLKEIPLSPLSDLVTSLCLATGCSSAGVT